MRAHVSLNVSDVEQSIEFYKKVFNADPQKKTSTYAKFDLQHPSLNFSMQSGIGKVSRVNHFGIEVDSAEEISKWQRQLEERGILGKPEMNTDCCYARQDKIWLTDPDGNSWEIFYVYEQLPVVEENSKGCCG